MEEWKVSLDDAGRDIERKLTLKLSSVFSFSSSHSLSEPAKEGARCGVAPLPALELVLDEVEDAALAVSTAGLAGMTVTVGFICILLSTRSPCPASSLHCTFFAAPFLSLSETRL